MKKIFITFCRVLIAFIFLFKFNVAVASEWAVVTGNVYFEGQPACALVLINGQSKFSCGGTGSYEILAPLDQNGLLTVMVFADGFAPYQQTITPAEALNKRINIQLDQGSPSFSVESNYAPAETEGRYIVSGKITFGDIPVCALALANGQNMFTCQENVGHFSLNVPADNDGNIVLMVFADGFKPFNLSKNVLIDSDGDGVPDYLDQIDIFAENAKLSCHKANPFLNQVLTEFTLQNKTGHILSKIDFRLKFSAPGILIPITSSFYYEPSGGIVGPYKSTRLELVPNAFNNFTTATYPYCATSGRKLEVEIIGAYDQNGIDISK